MFDLLQFITGIILAVLISGISWKMRALSPWGAAAATALGAVVFGLGGVEWAVVLLGFFISSSALSRLKRRHKASLDEKFSKGSQRDAGQVLANGGIAGLCVLIHAAFPAAVWAWPAFAGTLAAANADTWATELGVLSRSTPRLITSRKLVERGTSGGVTSEGTLASLGGSLLIALLAVFFWPGGNLAALPLQAAAWVVLITLAGLAGSLLDSLLGASVQAIYTCPNCQKETERHPYHTCGTATTWKRGLGWLNNDLVNTACALAGAGVTLLLIAVLPLPLSAGGSLNQPGIQAVTGFELSSPAFTNGATIPPEYTCDGLNLSPALQWTSPPPATRSLALIADDPDAPVGTWVHWVIYNLPANLASLPGGVEKTPQALPAGTPGTNDFRQAGYGGPCPPPGSQHRYFFKIYALDVEPNLPAGLTAAGLMDAIRGHILAEAKWMGRYKRQE